MYSVYIYYYIHIDSYSHCRKEHDVPFYISYLEISHGAMAPWLKGAPNRCPCAHRFTSMMDKPGQISPAGSILLATS